VEVFHEVGSVSLQDLQEQDGLALVQAVVVAGLLLLLLVLVLVRLSGRWAMRRIEGEASSTKAAARSGARPADAKLGARAREWDTDTMDTMKKEAILMPSAARGCCPEV
jgi:hypothetical protein